MTENGSHVTDDWVRLHGFAGDEIVVLRWSIIAALPTASSFSPCTTVVLDGGHRVVVREHLSEVLALLGIAPGEAPKNYDKVYREAFERQAQQIAEQMRTINENDLKIEGLQEELAATRIASSAKDDRIKALVAQLQQTTEALKKVQGELDAARIELNRLRHGDYWRGDGWKITWTGTGTGDPNRAGGLGDYAKWPGTKD